MKKNRHFPLFLFYLLFLTATSLKTQSLEPFTFAFVSDVHISSGRVTPSIDLLRTVKDINSNPNISFTIFTGDITEFGSDKELLETKHILDKLDTPWYVVPGNHDANWSESGTNSFGRILGHERFKFESHGMVFIGIGSGPNMRMSPGLVPREDVVWLRSTLENLDKDKPVVFFNHYPINESLANWYLVIDELKKVNTQAILHGHGHRNKANRYEGIPATMGRSNLRAGEEIGGYNLVSVTEDSLIFAEKRPGKERMKPWRKIERKDWNFADDTTSYPRSSYKVNDKYDQVQVAWEVQDSSDIGAGIAVADGVAIHPNTEGRIVARNLKTGEQLWAFQTGGKIYSTPAVKGKNVVIASTDSSIYNIDLEDGSLRWKTKTGKSIVASPVIDQNSIYIGSSEDKFRSLALSDGSIQWVNEEVQGFMSSKPLVDEQHVYFGGWGNYFYALDKKTGSIDWRWTNGSSNRMLSPAAVYPVKADGKIFIVAPDRYTTCLDAKTGKQIWRSNKHKGRESIGISGNDKLIFTKAMNDSLFAYSARAEKMKLQWAMDLGFGYEISPSPITAKNGIIYVPTDDGRIYAVDQKAKKILWIHKISNAMVNYVFPLNDTEVIATTMDGKIIRLNYNGF